MVSRVAKHPVAIPSDVEVKLDSHQIVIKGKKGTLRQTIPTAINVSVAENTIQLQVVNGEESDALAGTTRALIQNMVRGVTQGFERKLVMVGVGYRAKPERNVLNLTVGFSHPVNLPLPEGIQVESPIPTEIIVKGADKQAVNQFAAEIRAIRPPEPYKGKGIRYDNELIVLKETKKKK